MNTLFWQRKEKGGRHSNGDLNPPNERIQEQDWLVDWNSNYEFKKPNQNPVRSPAAGLTLTTFYFSVSPEIRYLQPNDSKLFGLN